MAVGHIEYTYFLKGMNIDTKNWMNFEPNYLDAMMRAYPSELRDAKDAYMADILEVHGHDAREALRWMQTQVEAVGTE